MSTVTGTMQKLSSYEEPKTQHYTVASRRTAVAFVRILWPLVIA